MLEVKKMMMQSLKQDGCTIIKVLFKRKLYNDSQPARMAVAKDNKKRMRKFQEQKS